MSDIIVKCRQCRRLIAKQPLSSFLTAHGQPVADIYGCSLTCVGKLEDVWYLDELTMSDWMRTAVEEVRENQENKVNFSFGMTKNCFC